MKTNKNIKKRMNYQNIGKGHLLKFVLILLLIAFSAQCNESNVKKQSPPTSIPLAPSVAPTISTKTFDTITLEWEAVTGATYYEVHRSDAADGTYTKINQMTITSLSYTDMGLTPSTTYHYRINACNSIGCSVEFSPVVSDSTEAPPPIPNVPAAARVSTNTLPTSDAITIEWTTVTGATYYEVHRLNPTTSNYEKINQNNIEGDVYTDEGLMTSTTYYYKIKACNITACSALSPEVDGTTLSISSPQNLKILESSDTSLILDWDEVTGAAYYEVHRSTSDASYVKVSTANITDTMYTDDDPNLTTGTIYYYKVKACLSTDTCSALSDALVYGVAAGQVQTTELLITEISENNTLDVAGGGASCNGANGDTADCKSKAFIELGNSTGATIDLSNYALLYARYGRDLPTDDTDCEAEDHLINTIAASTCSRLLLAGMLPTANLVVIGRANHDLDASYTANFIWDDFLANGNDTVVLAEKKGAAACPAGTAHSFTPNNGPQEDYCIIDRVGEMTDPGTAWTVAGTPEATQMIIRRKSSVASPNTDWTASRGTDVSDSEWVVYPTADFQNVGVLTDGTGTQPQPPSIPAAAPTESTTTPPTQNIYYYRLDSCTRCC